MKEARTGDIRNAYKILVGNIHMADREGDLRIILRHRRVIGRRFEARIWVGVPQHSVRRVTNISDVNFRVVTSQC
jgi:hypothetical protein